MQKSASLWGLLLCVCLVFVSCNGIEIPSDSNGDDSLAYNLVYTSNGDGTCYVSAINIDLKRELEFEIEIPKTAPNGELVTAIKCEPFPLAIPLVISVEDFRELTLKMEANFERGAEEFYYKQVLTYFNPIKLSDISPDLQAEVTTKYPLSTVTDFYMFSPDATEVEMRKVVEALAKYGEYTMADMIEDYNNLYALVNQSTVENKEAILATLPAIPTGDSSLVRAVKYSDSVTEISSEWLFSFPKLRSLTIPGNVTEIPFSAFANNDILTSITISESVISIGDSAFIGCTSLNSLTIPNSVTILNNYAFSGCTSLNSLTIPNSLMHIGDYVFQDCTALTSITYNGTRAEWESVTKAPRWDYTMGSYTIYCTDGTIEK